MQHAHSVSAHERRGKTMPLPSSGSPFATYMPFIKLPPWLLELDFPAGSLPGLRMWESCQTMPLVGGFSRGSSVSNAPHSSAVPYSHLFTFIGSQGVDQCRNARAGETGDPRENPTDHSGVVRHDSQSRTSGVTKILSGEISLTQ
ncbi:hypothetical protein PR048_015146 [Dryococelus australis]|uniref:Uncharacterized protein n=1 Tax=Dryococelus australis TaxID=614101 RepID=A0ABQ9HG53_9NEOP|nr:hypothetical protein PR048_015146 [Dryococelus australis]